MAKKDATIDKKNYSEQVRKEIEEQYGSGVFESSRTIIDNPKKVFKFSPALDIGLGGGIPEGCLVTCSGPEKAGKTTSTLHFCKKFQEADPSREVYYLDAEGRLKEMNLSGIPGLDLDRFHLIHSVEGNILTAEKYLSIAEKIIHSHPGSLIVVDSISVLCPESEMTGDLTAQIRASGPRLFSLFCKRIANVLPVNRVILWGIQHLITNTSGYGAGRKEDGGVKIQYALDVKLRLKWGEDWEIGPQDNKKSIGKIAHWDIVTSALGALPNQKIDSYIRFGTGIDELKENIEIAISLDIIKKGGAWYTFGEEKIKGEEKLYQWFVSNPDMIKLLEEKIKELTG